MQAHARVCEENKLELEKKNDWTPIETISRIKVQVWRII